MDTSERCIRELGVRCLGTVKGAELAATGFDDERIEIERIQLPPLYTRHMGYSGGGKRKKVKWRFYPLEAVGRREA